MISTGEVLMFASPVMAAVMASLTALWSYKSVMRARTLRKAKEAQEVAEAAETLRRPSERLNPPATGIAPASEIA